MDIIAALEQRRSIRRYTKRPVEKEVLDRLLDLAVKAPTGSGLEPWGFVILQRQDEIDELSERIKAKVLEHIDRYPEFSQYESWLRNEKYHIFNHAGTVIVIYGDDRSPWYIHDCTLAAGNIMLAAGSEGLGCCWIGFARVLLDDDDFKKSARCPGFISSCGDLESGVCRRQRSPLPPKASRHLQPYPLRRTATNTRTVTKKAEEKKSVIVFSLP